MHPLVGDFHALDSNRSECERKRYPIQSGSARIAGDMMALIQALILKLRYREHDDHVEMRSVLNGTCHVLPVPASTGMEFVRVDRG